MALNTPAQFRLVLGRPPLARSERWSVHACAAPSAAELSTGSPPILAQPVDDQFARDVGAHSPPDPAGAPVARLGCIIPRRLARRAVTRALVRRQAREAAQRAQAAVPVAAWWVLRLAAPLRRDEYRSAVSPVLRKVVRAELEAAFGLAAKAWPGRGERRAGHAAR